MKNIEKNITFFFGPLIISIILFHIIWWGEHHLFSNTLRVQNHNERKRKVHAQTLENSWQQMFHNKSQFTW
jgi:uncharacterized protein HemY